MVGVGGQGGDEVAVRGKSQWKQIFSRGVGGDSAELSASVESWSNGSGPKYRKQKTSQKRREAEPTLFPLNVECGAIIDKLW